MTNEELVARRTELQGIFDRADEGSNARLISQAVLGLIEVEIGRRNVPVAQPPVPLALIEPIAKPEGDPQA